MINVCRSPIKLLFFHLSSAPVPCVGGEYSLSGSDACTKCPAGYACPAGAGSPTSCVSGTYAVTGQAACQGCPVGSACPSTTTGSNQYTCPSGKLEQQNCLKLRMKQFCMDGGLGLF